MEGARILFPKQVDPLSNLIKRNIFGSFVIKGVSIIINLLYVPLLINYLDTERYGIWIALTSFLTWFQFFDIGIGNGLRNTLTKVLVNKDYVSAKGLISTAYAMVFAIFVTVAALYSLIAFKINWNTFLNVNLKNTTELQLLAWMVFSGMCLQFIVQLIQPILFASQKSAISSIFPAASNLICLTLIYLCSTSTLPRLLSAGFILSSVPLLTFTIGSIILFNSAILRDIKPSLKHINLKYSKTITSLGFKFLFIQIAAVLLNSSASLILIKLFGPKEVTVYNIVYKYFQIALMINVIIVTPLWSGFTAKLAVKDYDWIRQTFQKMNITAVLLTILIVIMTVASPLVFKFWIGEKLEIPMSVTIMMAILFTQSIFLSAYNMFINGSGKIKLSMYFTIFEITSYIVFAYLLSKYWIGINGVILASIITKCFTFILQYIQVQKILNERAEGIWNQ